MFCHSSSRLANCLRMAELHCQLTELAMNKDGKRRSKRQQSLTWNESERQIQSCLATHQWRIADRAEFLEKTLARAFLEAWNAFELPRQTESAAARKGLGVGLKVGQAKGPRPVSAPNRTLVMPLNSSVVWQGTRGACPAARVQSERSNCQRCVELDRDNSSTWSHVSQPHHSTRRSARLTVEQTTGRACFLG
jgi:hypothetical protein